MKRKAEFSLDRNALEKDGLEYQEHLKSNLNENVGRIQTPEEIKQRRFLKIKGLKAVPQENPQKSFFHLAKPLETTIVPPPKEQISFLSNQPKPPEPSTNSNQNQENKAENIEKHQTIQPHQKTISPKKQELQHSPHKNISVQKSTENKEEEEKKNDQTSKTSNEKAEVNELATESKSKQPLFGGFKTQGNALTFSGTKTSFFNVSNPLMPNTTAPSIFQNTSANLFGNPSGPSLFPNNTNGNQNKNNGSIFSNLFSQPLAANNNLKKDSDDEDDGSDGGAEANPEPQTPEQDHPLTSNNFQYDESSEKFGEKDVLEFGSLSLEKVKVNDKDSFLVIYRNPAKLIMYQGWVLKKLTVAGTLNKNPDCMTLALFSQNKDKKLSKDLCKIKFLSPNDSTEFKTEVEKVCK